MLSSRLRSAFQSYLRTGDLGARPVYNDGLPRRVPGRALQVERRLEDDDSSGLVSEHPCAPRVDSSVAKLPRCAHGAEPFVDQAYLDRRDALGELTRVRPSGG